MVNAPISGTITVAYETKHAYGIKSNNGTEILIHLDIDTINLKGQYFDSKVSQGQHVTAGEALDNF
ncbi:MAG TPA: PTS glucose transporter subunit IIA [Weissella thailandensis]|uniref:PTS glucose transporter subunit IIA n=1 Tax=Weissella thailandensis TaxID=89061 RepID=UPI001DB10ED1|nr:PTS glucose transporter subunit IIA [Weissella thailandensis]HJG85272.1 PTS glucose transporter subunit IIA [Weissella thailandensis]